MRNWLKWVASRVDFLSPMPWVFMAVLVSLSSAIHLHYYPDSMLYVEIAKNIASGHGITTYHLNLNSPTVPTGIVRFPPVYPLLLASIMRIGLNVAWACRIVIILSLPLTTAFIYAIGKRLMSPSLGVVSAILWILVSSSRHLYDYAVSEPLFVVLSMAFALVLLGAAGRNGISCPRMIAAGILAGIAALCRYIGVVNLFAGAVFLGFAAYGMRSRPGVKQMAAAFSCLLLGFCGVSSLWLVRNLILHGHILEEAYAPPSPTGFFVHAPRLLRTMVTDLIVPGAITLALLGIGMVRRSAVPRPDGRRASFRKASAIVFSAAWIFGFASFLLYMRCNYVMDDMETRLAWPMYVFAIPLILLIGFSSCPLGKNGGGRVLNVIAAIVFAYLLFYDLPKNTKKELASLEWESRNVRPIETWIRQSTSRNSLIINSGGWWIPFKCDRAVLLSGHPHTPRLVPERVLEFLHRFGHHFDGFYVLVFPDQREFVTQYREIGCILEEQDMEAPPSVYKITW
ncbi:MAG: glycosyltransferase family 39 protein [bacterium]|nr:glycosyltransferase family 39 protein [bacterium]